jgi:NADPH-dependent glutamate synthase beta subunit-like oxidoreductase/Pyruvate/2-oxoacid:ferredoxin oxidoreductase delta subunit
VKKEFNLEKMEGLPPLAVSFWDTLSIRTGAWRYLRPLFQPKTAPCHAACPAGEDIVEWIHLIHEGKLEEAYHLILEENPFPGICGRVCFHPCEGACNRANFDQAIPIHLLERFLADFGNENCSPSSTSFVKRDEKIAIIGAGPSGLACAYHLGRIGYDVTVYEASPYPGGVLRTGIPEYRLPKSILDREIDFIKSFGVKIETQVRVNKLSDLQEFASVYIATGAPKSLRLATPGEDLPGTISGLDFLQSINLGQTRQMEGTVAIVGGGNTAIDAARCALRMGAKPLILYRRSRQEMPAFEEEVKEAEAEGIEILYQVSPIKIVGEKDKVRALECVRMRLEEQSSSGRRQPVPIEGSNFMIEANGVINAVGQIPDLSFLDVDVETQGPMILTDFYASTNRRGIFAGGDVTVQPRTVVHAIGVGKIGAIAIDQNIRGEDIKGLEALIKIGETGAFSMKRYMEREGGTDSLGGEVVRYERINLDYFEKTDPVSPNRISPEKTVNNFLEVNQGLTDAAVRDLARRCFSCGLCDHCGNCLVFCPDMAVTLKDDASPEFNDDYCKGCGICFTECPRNVISMEEEKE